MTIVTNRGEFKLGHQFATQLNFQGICLDTLQCDRVHIVMVKQSVKGIEMRQSIMEINAEAPVTLYEGDCLDLLEAIPDATVQLVVTSPPYNIKKVYEPKKMPLEEYLADQSKVIARCAELLTNQGSICWEVGNHVHNNEVFPLDALLYPIFKANGLRLRNRIVWHYEHGLHSSRRFSGRYETILWFTKNNEYVFNLDPVRVPQKVSRQEALQRFQGRSVFFQSTGQKSE